MSNMEEIKLESLKREMADKIVKFQDMSASMERIQRDVSQMSMDIKTLEGVIGKKQQNSMEISDKDAPRCGEPWTQFEREHTEQRFREFILRRAKKFGRSTLAIKYRLLGILVKDLPNETLIDKIREMMRGVK